MKTKIAGSRLRSTGPSASLPSIWREKVRQDHMQITITGGTGSLSQYIQDELAGKHELVLFDRVAPGQNRINYEIKYPVVVGDLTSFDDCQRAVAGSQAVIHLGAIPFPVEHPVWGKAVPGGSSLPWDETMRVNTMGT